MIRGFDSALDDSLLGAPATQNHPAGQSRAAACHRVLAVCLLLGSAILLFGAAPEGSSHGPLGLFPVPLIGRSSGAPSVASPSECSAESIHLADPPWTVDALRLATKSFVDSLGDDIKGQTYYADASLQVPQWQLCTIVQQCLVPKYGLAVGRLLPGSRTLLYSLLALALSDESYQRILVQQLSNLLLGEMQTWATSCPGHCEEMNAADGLLPHHLLKEDVLDSQRVNATYAECAALADAKRKVFWSCEDHPRMLHHGNIDTSSGKYFLGNVFLEPTIHARNHYFDFVSVYGSLEPGQPFGFRVRRTARAQRAQRST